jgi:KAP family P-loop domain
MAAGSKYTGYRVILDAPTAEPVLGFDAYASALCELIQHSRPEFSVGIFGSWGSGKTSLMQAIQRKLGQPEDPPSPPLITVWFNPWRYEREEHLIVPMLDTLREAIVDWSNQQPPEARDRAMKAASMVGRAARAILAGVSLTAKLPFFEANVDPGRVMGSWRREGIDDPIYAQEPQSFYHASFVAMHGALSEFFARDVTRVVIFVDDLDRCLPDKALEVLESMKLFFDLEGCVFVVGLDQSIIERAVAEKYKTSGAPDGQREISGSEYVKKIFQVPFGVPPIRPQQLTEYLLSIASSAGLGPEQNNDLSNVVGPHLGFLAEEQALNPREIKRFINAYTLQVKMLEPRLGAALKPDAVLAVQAMTFRADWRDLYKQLIPDPRAFSADLDVALRDGYWPDRKRTPIPPSFATYVQGPGAVLRNASLEEYIASVEATHFTDQSLLELEKGLRELWRAWGNVGEEEDAARAAGELQSALKLLASHATREEGPFGSNLNRKTDELSRHVARLQQGGLTSEALTGWRERFSQLLESIEDDVDERRRLTSVGGVA